MRIKGSDKNFKRKHVPKIEYASELSVADIEELGENIIDNADRLSMDQLVIKRNSQVKFHNVDDSIGLLFESLDTQFIS